MITYLVSTAINFIVAWVLTGISAVVEEILNSLIDAIIIKGNVLDVFDGSAKDIFDYTKTVGISLLILITSYQGLKSMFAGMGFDQGDEPRTIMFRSGFLAFFILSSKDLAKYLFDIYGIIASTANKLISGLGFTPIVFKGLNAFALFGSWGAMLQLMFFVFMMTKMFGMLMKFAERYVLSIIFAVFIPMAIACLATKPTREIGTGFFRMFFGNMVVQFVQIICLALVRALAGGLFTGGLVDLFYAVGIILVIEKLDDTVNNISMSAGLGSDALASARGDVGKSFKDTGNAIMKAAAKAVK